MREEIVKICKSSRQSVGFRERLHARSTVDRSEEQTAMSEQAESLKGKRANWTIAHKVEDTVVKFVVKDAGTLELDIQKIHPNNYERAAVHGLVQRVSDAAAMARDTKTGKPATPQEKYEAMKRLVEWYNSGAEGWSPQRAEGKEREQSGVGDLRQALEEMYPEKPAERIREYVKGLKKEERAALMGQEKVRRIVERIRDERAKVSAAGVDAEELLRGLG